MRGSTRAVIFGFACAAGAFGDSPGQQQAAVLLNSMERTYSSFKAMQVVARREIAPQGFQSTTIDLEYAGKSGRKYFVRVKEPDQIVLTAGNGEKTWKALPKTKQFSVIEAAASAPPESGENAEDQPTDPYSTTRATFLSYAALAKVGASAWPEFVKQNQVKLESGKTSCGVVRFQLRGTTNELCIDDRGLVLQQVQTAVQKAGNFNIPVKSTLKVKSIEVDNDVSSNYSTHGRSRVGSRWIAGTSLRVFHHPRGLKSRGLQE